jgi:beta-lactam-binding protein with PASTA domain
MKLMTAVPVLVAIGGFSFAVQAYTQMATQLLARLDHVVAPTLTAKTLADANETARAQGLQVTVAGSRPSDSVAKDLVLSQNPRPGARTPRGATIALTLSAGVRPPSIIGQPLEAAGQELSQAGWQVAPEVELRPWTGSPPGVVLEQQPGPEEFVPQPGLVRLVVAAPNLALGKRVQTSTGGQILEATDGQPETVARPPGSPSQWIEVDLGSPVTVQTVSLLVALERPGPATIEVWAWDAKGRFFPLHLFNEELEDGATLQARLAEPVLNVVRLRVATTAAPGPLGWREISVLDR